MIVVACLRGKHLVEDLPKRAKGSTGVQKPDFLCRFREHSVIGTIESPGIRV
jgi:hypothetical protein